MTVKTRTNTTTSADNSHTVFDNSLLVSLSILMYIVST